MLITFAILALTLALLISNKIRSDIVALLALLALFLTSRLTLEQTLAGFADPVVVLVAGLFVVAEGISRTGLAAWLGEWILGLAGASEKRLFPILIIATALLSGFLGSVGTVTLLLPVVVAAAAQRRISPSRLFMPLAFAANFGGLLTLIGLPATIVISELAVRAGQRPFAFFEIGLVGLPLLFGALLFWLLTGQRFWPSASSSAKQEETDNPRPSLDELVASYAAQGSLARLQVPYHSGLVGLSLAEAALGRDYNLNVLRIERLTESKRQRSLQIVTPEAATVIEANDSLIVKGLNEAIELVAAEFELEVLAPGEEDAQLATLLLSQETGLAEVLIAPHSELVGQTLSQAHFSEKYKVQALTIWRYEQALDLKEDKLAAGDVLLVRGTWRAIRVLQAERRNFVLVADPTRPLRQALALTSPVVTALVALVGLFLLLLTQLVPPVIAVLLVGLVMFLGGVVQPDDGYRAINWQSVIMLAALLGLANALQIGGGANWLAQYLVRFLDSNPFLVLVSLFLLTAAFSQIISSLAAVILIAPIALACASFLQVSSRPLLIIVVIGSAAVFLTPIASPVNSLIYTAGNYKFNVFFKAGLPLLLLCFILSLWLVPFWWPF